MVVRVGKRIQRIDRDDVLLNTALPLFLLAGVAVFAAGVWKIAALLVEMI
jgi:hypothetical protein